MEVIFEYLKAIGAHNNREWFWAHRAAFDEAMEHFVKLTEALIAEVAKFDPRVAGIEVKNCLYRFARDTRFSPDKSPYKRHFGAYINPKGKKSMHGGYYLHLEPGGSLLAGGEIFLEPQVLRAIRQKVVDFPKEYLSIVENDEFKKYFPQIGMSRLKTFPTGFPRDFAYPELIRPKDFSVSLNLPDEFFFRKEWMNETVHIFKVMMPFLDFANEVIDDYE